MTTIRALTKLTTCIGFKSSRIEYSNLLNCRTTNCNLINGSRLKSTKSRFTVVKPQLIVDNNISLRLCQTGLDNVDISDTDESSTRPLVILLSWLMASEKHLEKYRSIYFKHGFDVLTVKTKPVHMLFPVSGSQKVAQNLLNFLQTKISHYPNVVIHGFSVGAYQFGELLRLLKADLSEPSNHPSYEVVRKAIKGMIFDSAVDVEGAPYGISRSIMGDGSLADILEKAIKLYLRLFYNVATQHYEKSSDAFRNTPLRCPALLMLSHEDRLGNPVANEELAKQWRKLGINVSWKCWDSSRHVAHLHKYPDEYVSEVESFLKRINLGKHE